MKLPIDVSLALLRQWPLPDPQHTHGKDDRGQVLIIGGSLSVPGGVLLAAVAALRAGAGKLQIAAPAPAAVAIGIKIPEAKVLAIPTSPDGELGTFTAELASAVKHADAVLIGPGMGSTERVQRFVTDVAGASAKSLVLDAGAIQTAKHLTLSAETVLTPNYGEAAQLSGLDIGEIEHAPLLTASDLAARKKAVVALKSATTYIVHPDGRRWRHQGGGPGLGTSGSGDVLAGLIAGLCARGATVEQASVAGVWLHAQAGSNLAKQYGTLGFLARQLAREVPRLMMQLQSND